MTMITMISPKIILLTGFCLTFIVSIHAEGALKQAVKIDAGAHQNETVKDGGDKHENHSHHHKKGPHDSKEKKLGGCIKKRYLLRDCNQIVTSIAAKKMGTYIDETRKLRCHTIALPEHCLGGSGEDGDCGCENRHEGKHHSGCSKGHRGHKKLRYSGEMGDSNIPIGGNATQHQHGHGEKHHSKEHGHGQKHHSKEHGHGEKHHSKEHGQGQKHHSKEHGHGEKHHSKEHGHGQKHHSKEHGHGEKHHSKEKHGSGHSKEKGKGVSHGHGGKTNSKEKHGPHQDPGGHHGVKQTK